MQDKIVSYIVSNRKSIAAGLIVVAVFVVAAMLDILNRQAGTG